MKTFTTLIAVALFLALASPVVATQDPAQDSPADPIEQLRLTPEQRQRIRVIFEENKQERQSTNRRLREANVALDQALDADPINESVIEQRINELAAAQAAQLRMRIQTEIKIRRELRPEQMAILRSRRLQIRDVVNPQRPANTFTPRRGPNALRPNSNRLSRP
jgi:Spy/CpxP family protein refolding chaperone